MIFFLALRNLVLQRKRYAVIGIAVALGFALITIISGATAGALGTVRDKAARYFAGHISITGYTPDRAQRISDPDRLIDVLHRTVGGIRTISRRTVYYRQDAKLFFGGESIRQRRLVGIDFDSESQELRGMKFQSGSLDAMLGDGGIEGILVSQTAADLLRAKVGDSIELFLTTDTGQYNTATLVIKGIFQETSLFGFAGYLRNQDLNALLGRPADAATDIAVYGRNGVDLVRLAQDMHAALSAEMAVFPVLSSKSDRSDALSSGLQEETMAIMTLDAHLAQITDILDAFTAISYFVLLVFVLIVMVGILNTYRVLVYERTREIGTMRALGMKRPSVIALFVCEAAMLAVAASVIGLVVGIAGLWILGSINFGAIAAAAMFTNAGHLGFFVDGSATALNLLAMIVAVMIAAYGPARNAGAIKPADAMRTNS
ncbi:MAG TPA: FtsX-like permease family protein [bacterium]|nr:FtsX-like permease family protein [bacterium]